VVREATHRAVSEAWAVSEASACAMSAVSEVVCQALRAADIAAAAFRQMRTADRCRGGSAVSPERASRAQVIRRARSACGNHRWSTVRHQGGRAGREADWDHSGHASRADGRVGRCGDETRCSPMRKKARPRRLFARRRKISVERQDVWERQRAAVRLTGHTKKGPLDRVSGRNSAFWNLGSKLSRRAFQENTIGTQ
jgi:hypothetical protein